MRIWEIINISDPITILADDFEYAVAAAMSLGEGKFGLQEYPEGLEMPMFFFSTPDYLENWFRATFTEKQLPKGVDPALEAFLEGLDKFRLAEVLRSTQVCSGKERAAYQKALEMIDDGAKKQEYARWWKEERRTSMADIAAYGWRLAERLENIARRPKDQSLNPQETL